MAPELWLACLAVLAFGAVGLFLSWRAKALGASAEVSRAIFLLAIALVVFGWIVVNVRWWAIEWRERSDG